ncbi:MAG: PaaI family thioesterase [Rhodospirillales bacterium]|nr:PaaI family thioesterase [Rhodospirillales bacterium]
MRRGEDGPVFGFIAEAKHANVRGVVHGGMLMTFADEALGRTVAEAVGDRPLATIQLDTHFLAPARLGDFVEARARVTRRTRSVVFVEGVLAIKEHTIARAHGIWKVLKAE